VKDPGWTGQRFLKAVRPAWQGILALAIVAGVGIVLGGAASNLLAMRTDMPTHCPGRNKVDADLRCILTVAQAISTDTGRWPESIEEMVDAKTADGKPAIASLEKLPKDPWFHEYKYEIIDGSARVTCLGKDGVPGGEGEAIDVVIPAGGMQP